MAAGRVARGRGLSGPSSSPPDEALRSGGSLSKLAPEAAPWNALESAKQEEDPKQMLRYQRSTHRCAARHHDQRAAVSTVHGIGHGHAECSLVRCGEVQGSPQAAGHSEMADRCAMRHTRS